MNAGPCGILCIVCHYYVRGLCRGCVRGDLCPPSRAEVSACPILRCAADRKIPYCSRDCPDFPCALFGQSFPYCWFREAYHRPDMLSPEAWEPAGPPMPEAALNAEQPHPRGLRVFCLGTFRVYRGSEEIRNDDWGQGRGPTQKIKAMLAYLLSQKQRGARKETLCDFLWPEQTDSDQADASFHPALYCLRRALEPDLKLGADSSYIRYAGGRYRFDPAEPAWIDADAFEAYCRRARECDRRGDTETAVLYRGMALDVYGGDYMAGIPIDYTDDCVYDWCRPRRHRLRELYLEALLEMARYHRDIGDYGSCLRYANAALEQEPAFEPAHRMAIQALIKCGQPNAAIHQYRMCEAELIREAGVPPSQQTQILYEQLVSDREHR